MQAEPIGEQEAAARDHDDRATISVFATVAASVIAALYYAGRLGFDNPARPVLATLGLSLFIIVTPFIAWRVSRGHDDEPQPWWRSQPALTIAALAVTALAGMLVPATGLNVAVILAAVGYASALAALTIWIRQGSQRVNLVFVMGSAAFAAWACGVAWSTRYKTPVFWETLAYRADVHHDPLYYVSMANMMRSYGVPSTGLDGVPYGPYHYGSAWLNSQWAYLAELDVLAFYSLGPPVIVIPLFFAAVLLLALEVMKSWRGGRGKSNPPLKKDYAAWLFFLAATVGLIPTAGLDAMGIWNLHALISESYVIGVPVFLLAMATSIAFWRRWKTAHRADGLVFLLAFAPLMLAVTGFLKISLMVLLLCSAFGVAVLGRMLRDRMIAASAVLCIATSLVTYKLVTVEAQNEGIVPFAFMRYSGVDAAWWPWFILAHLFWSWVYIYLRLREEKLGDVGAIRRAVLDGRITDVLAVAVIAIAGWLPGEVINIHGGSAIYFSDVQRWVALSLLMAGAWRWTGAWRERQRQTVASGGFFGRVRLPNLWLAALVIPISLTLILNGIRAPVTALKANIALRRGLYAEAGVNEPVGLRSLADRRILEAGLQRAPAYTLVAALRELDETQPALKRRTLVFIPQTYARFWQIWKESDRCSFIPMLVPATSGLALLDGMPRADCDLTDQYGMVRYNRRTVSQLPADVTPDALCAKANAKGFSRVVTLNGSGDSGVAVNAIECPVSR